MSLYGLRLQFPDRFKAQDWFAGESFMDTPAPDSIRLPEHVLDATHPPNRFVKLPTAVQLAALFLQSPEHPMWERYLWTSDLDRFGQRVYVGVNHGLFEIHRHIHLTSRFAIPTWA